MASSSTYEKYKGVVDAMVMHLMLMGVDRLAISVDMVLGGTDPEQDRHHAHIAFSVPNGGLRTKLIIIQVVTTEEEKAAIQNAALYDEFMQADTTSFFFVEQDDADLAVKTADFVLRDTIKEHGSEWTRL